MMFTMALLVIFSLMIYVCDILLLKPKRLRSKLQAQGFRGPPPSFLLGNIRDLKMKRQSKVSNVVNEEQVITHNLSSSVFPIFEQWRKKYGPIFMFSLGNTQYLYVNRLDVVKEITICTSLDFGKPSYQQKEFAPLLGQGILTSNGAIWAHQRKILAPEFNMDKIKEMMDLMVDSSITLLNSWNNRINESESGVADIKIDEDLRSFSGDVISRAFFGSNYSRGEEIFLKLRKLQELTSKKGLPIGIPGLRYLPTKNNRKIWRVEKEVRSLILKVVKERRESITSKNDLLQMILEGATNDLGQAATNNFIVDNCKNIYLAGYEGTTSSTTWILMLLASHPEWQHRARAEVFDVCGGQSPHAEMVRKMKILTMIIHESLRLYPPGGIESREALQDIKLGDIHVPKGVIVWTLAVSLHQDPEIWGPDADKFNPERFANGVSGACKHPYVYMPFGVGPRTCLGQNFAMAEVKILLSVLLSNFSFALSPKYRHSPAMKVGIEPEHGVYLLIRRLQ